MTSTQPLINQLTTLANQHTAIAVSGVLAATNTNPPSTQSPTLEVKRPWLDPPEGFSPYDYQAGVALPAVGAASTTNLTSATGSAAVLFNGLGLVIPDGSDGVINALSCNFTGAGFTDFSGDITWTLYANSTPVKNFANILAQKGTVQQPREISPIRLYSNVTYTWVVTHAANPSLNGQVVCTMTGYIYPNRG